MEAVCYNGTILPAHQPLFTAQNRSFRYGDGLFETMKIFQNNILLFPYHFDRLYTSLHLLNIHMPSSFSQDKLYADIMMLCKQNNCNRLGRVRLAVFRNENNQAEYVIEANALSDDIMEWNKNGWTTDIYPFARKSGDAFSNLKTANFLPYVLAAHYAKEKKLDEVLVLNTSNAIADGSKTNIFLIKDNEVYTPALHQGCINGVMRRYVIDELKKNSFIVHQIEVKEEMLWQADEIFLTNALVGIRWVEFFREKHYAFTKTKQIYQLLF